MNDQHIQASIQALIVVRIASYNNDWDRLDVAISSLQSSMRQLRQHMEGSNGPRMSQKDIAVLRQLEMMQRKTMRSLSEKKADIQMNINMIEDAQSRLRKTAEVAGLKGSAHY